MNIRSYVQYLDNLIYHTLRNIAIYGEINEACQPLVDTIKVASMEYNKPIERIMEDYELCLKMKIMTWDQEAIA